MIKIITVLLLFCLVPAAYADDTGSDDGGFEEITGGLFTDLELLLQNVVKGIVAIFALFSIAAILGGWIGHSEKWFMRGVKGFGVLILAAVLYFIGVNGFNYVVTNYW